MDDYIKFKTIGLIELTESYSGIFYITFLYKLILINHLIIGAYLKETVLNVLKKFKINQNQIYSITTDNGANMVKAVY